MTKNCCLGRAREVLTIEMEAIAEIRDGLGDEFVQLTHLCRQTLDAGGKLVISGVGKSGHVGHKIAASLSSTGSRAAFLHPVEAMHGDLGVLAEGDLFLALSYSGETDELLDVLPAVSRLGVRIVGITGGLESRLAQWSDLIVPMVVHREACPFNLAPTATTTALLALGDALAMVLLDISGFAEKDYAKLHPSGAIGRSVTLRVSDLMRVDDRFPRVGPEVAVRDALLEMTRARSGSVAVVGDDGRLLGIFTDGDFRRHVMADTKVLESAVRDVMTPNPVTVFATDMAVELLNILEQRRIDDIIAVDAQGRAVGLVDIQDLPRFKVM